MPLSHDHIRYLRRHHPVLRLLATQNLALIAGFLYEGFVEPNRREMRQSELEVLLDDYLHGLRAQEGEDTYPRAFTWMSGRSRNYRSCASIIPRMATSLSTI